MAGSFNPDTSGLDMNNLIEALQTIMDAAQGLRNFNNEVSDSTRKVTDNKRAAQDLFRGFAKETTAAGREMERTTRELKRINDALPDIIKNTMSTIEKNFAFTSQELNRDFRLDKWMNPIFNEYRILQKKSIKDFEDQLDDIESALSSVTDEVERASLKYQKDLIEERKENVKNKNEWQLMASDNAEYWRTQSIKAGKKVLTDLYNFAKSKINSAVSSYASTMQSTYTTIQSYNNYTEKQYNQMFKRLQKSIDDAGLNNIININELQQQYTGAIQGGLKGELAERNAYYAQIGKQAGVTFDWNNSDWLKTVSRMSKQGNNIDKLSKELLVATENISEAAGHDFAFANGQIESLMSTLNSMQSEFKLTSDAYIQTYKSFGTIGSMLGEYQIDGSKFYSSVQNYATGGLVGSSTAELLNYTGTANDVENMIKSGRTDEITIDYFDRLLKRYQGNSNEFIKAASGVLGENFSDVEIKEILNMFEDYTARGTTFEEEFNRIYNYDKWAYDKMIESLENSETGQDKMQNTLDNIFDEIGKFTAMHPILTQIAQSVMTVAEMAAIGYFMGGTDSTGGRTIQTLLNKIFKAQGLGAGKAGSLASKITSSKAGSMIFSTGGKALGVAGSLISMGVDGYQGYQEDGWAGAARGAITGSGKQAESGWDVAKGTGSAALKGAGIGMVFGPWGAAIGAAVGGLVGLTTTLIDLNDEERKYNARLKSMSESTDKLNKLSQEYAKSMNELESVTNSAKAAESGNTDEVRKLVEKWPILNKYVDKNGKLSGDYAEVLEGLIALEQQRTFGKTIGSYSGSNKMKGSDYDKHAINANNRAANYGAAVNFQTDLNKADGSLESELKSGSYFQGGAKDDSGVAYTGASNAWGYHKSGDLVFGFYTDDGFVSIQDSSTIESYSKSDTGAVGGMISRDYITRQFINSYGGSMSFLNNLSDDAFVGFMIARGLLTAEGDVSKYTNAYKNEFINLANSSGSDILGKEFDSTYENVRSWINSGYINSVMSFSSLAEASTYSDPIKSVDEITADLNSMIKAYNGVMKYLVSPNEYVRSAALTKLGIKNVSEFIDFFTASPLDIYKKFGEDNDLIKPIGPNDTYVINGDELVYTRGSYAVGTTGDSTIPYDNYLAYLHKGEQVRTAAEVAVERAEQHVASSNAIGQLNSAVMQQTNTIINLLTQILSVTTSLAGRVGAKPAQSYDYSPVSI